MTTKVTVECEHGVSINYEEPKYGAGVLFRGEFAVKIPIRASTCTQCKGFA